MSRTDRFHWPVLHTLKFSIILNCNNCRLRCISCRCTCFLQTCSWITLRFHDEKAFRKSFEIAHEQTLLLASFQTCPYGTQGLPAETAYSVCMSRLRDCTHWNIRLLLHHCIQHIVFVQHCKTKMPVSLRPAHHSHQTKNCPNCVARVSTECITACSICLWSCVKTYLSKKMAWLTYRTTIKDSELSDVSAWIPAGCKSYTSQSQHGAL